MLEISESQMGALERVAQQRFEDEMMLHCRRVAERLVAIRGESPLRQVIRLGMQRARSHGLTQRGPVRYHIDLMLALGCDFDTDPQLPWVAASLLDSEGMDELPRSEQLHRQAMDYFDAVHGPDNAYAIEALRAARALPLAEHLAPGERFEARVLDGLQLVHPRKARRVGEAGLQALFAGACDAAEQHGLAVEPAAGVLAALMFGFGHGIARDPLYPWVGACLKDEARPPAERLQRLHRKTMTYVDGILKHLAS